MISQKKMPNGFEYIEISNDSASAEIALQGAHIFHYTRHNEDGVLWLSGVSDFEYTKAIRGGVPICWPWFGMHKNNSNLPQHGFARTSMFELVESTEIDAKTTKIILKLQDSKESFSLWPYHFELLVSITVSDTLSMELSTKNLDNKAFEITQALHSYFDISHISEVEIQGLDTKTYFDALVQKEYVQEGVIRFDAELDRVYQGVDEVIVLKDKNRTLSIENEGSASVVVWNPWIDKCSRMSGMCDTAYEDFVCIESANALEDFRVLQSGETHTLKATIV